MSCHYKPYCEHYVQTQLNSTFNSTLNRNNSQGAKNSKSVLLIINVQNDLLLEKERSSSNLMIGSINELIDNDTFDMYVYCCDAHESNNISLVSNHPESKPYDVIVLNHDDGRTKETIVWPDHCVVGTDGIDFPNELNVPFKGKINQGIVDKINRDTYPCICCDDLNLDPDLEETIKSNQSKKSYIMVTGLSHGKTTDAEPFSVFKDSDMKETGLAQFLINHCITDVYLSGLSRDANVWWGAGDASSYIDDNNNKLFNVYFVLDATIPVHSSPRLPDYDPDGVSLHQKMVRGLGPGVVHNDLYKNIVDNNWVRSFLQPYGIKAITWSDAIKQTSRHNSYQIQQGGYSINGNQPSIFNQRKDDTRLINMKHIDFNNFLIKASKYKTKHNY
jgi:nicotinamidase-related amidase